jgi:hypothetical protein
MDGSVVESGLAQPLDSTRPDGRGPVTQLFGKIAERSVLRAQAGLAPVAGDLIDETVGLGFIGDSEIGDLGPEVVRVGANSIVAAVGPGDDHRKHLALPPAQGRLAIHDGEVERGGCLEHSRIQTLEPENLPQPAGPLEGAVVFVLERSGCVRGVNGGDPWHD